MMSSLPNPTVLREPLRRPISSASCCRRTSRSLACSTSMARARFWIWLRSFWQVTTMPVGRWVMRTAESVVFTPCRPGRAVDVDADLLVGDLDVISLLDDRRDVDVGEGRLPPRLVVERRDPDQP